MSLTGIDIEEIVQNVLKELQQGGTATSMPHTLKTESVVVASAKTNPPKSVSESPFPATPVTSTAVDSTPVHISGRVITADLLAAQVRSNQSITIESKALITPAAQDFLKEKRIQLVSQAQVQTARSQFTTTGWLGLVVNTSESLQSVLNSLSRGTGSSWSQQLSDSTEAAVQTAISEVCRGGMRGIVIFTEKVATATCLVNRNERIRGVAIHNVQELDVLTELNPNVICLPSRGLSFTDYRNILRQIIQHTGAQE